MDIWGWISLFGYKNGGNLILNTWVPTYDNARKTLEEILCSWNICSNRYSMLDKLILIQKVGNLILNTCVPTYDHTRKKLEERSCFWNISRNGFSRLDKLILIQKCGKFDNQYLGNYLWRHQKKFRIEIMFVKYLPK